VRPAKPPSQAFPSRKFVPKIPIKAFESSCMDGISIREAFGVNDTVKRWLEVGPSLRFWGCLVGV
jgi:hypothetical protein